MGAEGPSEVPDDRRESYRVEFASDDAEKPPAIADEVVKKLGALGWSEDEIDNFAVAIVEAATNAAIHGNGRKAEKKVSVEADLSGERAIVTVSDEGEGFDPAEVPDPTKEENLLKVNGRGVHIINKWADEAEFIRLPGGGMEVVLTKVRGRSPGGQ